MAHNNLPKALFIGNGINRVSQNAISWGDLLDRLSKKFEIDVDLSNELKPFPLAFEEMIHNRLESDSFEFKLRSLKTNISELLLEAGIDFDFTFHKEIMECGIKEIITTNYDYNLELSMNPDFIREKKGLAINSQESKHSLYRGYEIKDVNVRHIHGELLHNRKISNPTKNYPEESIMIGFEHYSEYFHRIQSVIKGPKGTYKDGVISRITNDKEIKIWADLFFTHNLYFIGFSLDFSETHLWWLLMQREEILRKYNFFELQQNTITFLYPEMPVIKDEYKKIDEKRFDKLFSRKLALQKNRAITDILKSFKVTIVPVPCDSYAGFYKQVVGIIMK